MPDPLATVADVASYLNTSIDLNDARAMFALRAASRAIRGWTGQTISKVEDDVVTLRSDNQATVRLVQIPVLAVASVVWDGATLDASEYDWSEAGLLWRPALASAPWVTPIGDFMVWPSEVVVTFTHGFDPVPDDVRMICAQLAGRIMQTPGSPGGVTAENIGDYGYSTNVQAALASVLAETSILQGYQTISF